MSKYGIIRFESIPKNAEVIVDNQYFGNTPLDIEDAESGNYIYKLSLKGHEDFVGNAIIDSSKILHIVVDFKNNNKTEAYLTLNNNSIESLSPFTNKKNYTYETIPPTGVTTESPSATKVDIQQQILDQLILLNEKTSATSITEPIYYDVSKAITQTTLIAPTNCDDPAYDRERVNELLGRNSKRLTITNDGHGNLFVRISHDGVTYSDEIPIYESDVKVYNDIWEVRLRSDRGNSIDNLGNPISGCKYRITEYPLNSVTVNVQKSEKIYVLSTDKDKDFTSALNMNYMETVHFTEQLISNRIKIIAINGQSKQPLKYRLIFWGSHMTQNTTDLNQDTYLTDVVMDFTDTLSSFQIDTGAGLVNQYYLDVSALEGLFDCYDQDYSLHVSLQNISPIAKLAGANGAVQFDIKYALRL